MNEQKWKAELLSYEEVFYNVMALYYILKGESRPQSIRRAELKQGEVIAEPIDFIADVELKVKRVLNSDQYRRFMSLVEKERYREVPAKYRQQLGLLFLRSNLNFDGDYRVLYFRAKNNQLKDREEPMQFPEEIEQ